LSKSSKTLFVICAVLSIPILVSAGEVTTLGGELRIRPEFRDNTDFNSNADDRLSFIGERMRLRYSGRPAEGIKGLVELQHTMLWGTTYQTTRSNDLPGVDFHQAFLSLERISETPLTISIGRQELSYGEERLIGPNDWSNYSRAFDALKIQWDKEKYSIDAFGTMIFERSEKIIIKDSTPVVIPSDSYGADTTFSGLYGSFKAIKNQLYEGYVLYLRDGLKKSGEGGTVEKRSLDIVTAGLRATGAVASFDLTGEFAYQFGKNYADNHQAYAGYARVGYTFEMPRMQPRLAVELIYASGDRQLGDGKSGEFIDLFPSNHAKYGAMDYFGWRNLCASHLNASAFAIENLKIAVDYFYFMLPQKSGYWKDADGNEMIPLSPLYAAEDNIFAGHEVDLKLTYIYRTLGIEGGYSIFLPGSYVKNFQGQADPSHWAYLQTRLSF